MLRSIRSRVALPLVSLILLVIFVLGLSVTRYIKRIYLTNLEENMQSQALVLADWLGRDEAINGPEYGEAVGRWSQILDMRLSLVAVDGTVLADSHEDPALMNDHSNRPEIIKAIDEGYGTSTRYSGTLQYEMLYVAVPILENNQIWGVIRLARSLDQVEKQVIDLQRVWLMVALLVSGAAILVAGFVSFQITKPIKLLTEKVVELTPLESDAGFPPSIRRNELDLLSASFTKMAESVQEKITALEAEKSKLATILQDLHDGVIIVNQDGTVDLMNRAAKEMFGTDLTALEGIPLVEATRVHQPVELWQQCKLSCEVQVAQFEVVKTRLFLQGMAAACNPSLPEKCLLIFQDITKQRNLEVMRREFVSNVSHKLRNPLAVIKLLVENLQNGALEDRAVADGFLEKIQEEVDSLSIMVQELLELSRTESGKVSLSRTPTSPLSLINAAAGRLILQAERAGITIEVDCSDALPQVFVDPARTEQVLVNLIHNAIKFSPSGSRVVVSAEQDGDFVAFTVQDFGIGIAERDLPHIFERFYKADQSRSSSGTGIGLSIAKHLIEAHGGSINATSHIGKGSTFIFKLPVVNL